ncbi:MAG: tetratricopeptide repeat protein [Promethearchaeota archaeon]
MKTCPYCNQPIEADWSYCHFCNKPLIVNIENRKFNRTIKQKSDRNDIYDIYRSDLIIDEKNYHFNEIKDDQIDQEIKRIDNILDQKEFVEEPIGSLLLEKSSLYYQKRDFSTALKILENALNNFIEENDILNVAISHNKMGLIHEDLGFFDDALYHFNRAIETLKNLNETQKLIQVYNNIANIYFLLNNLEYCFKYYNKALKLAEKDNLILEEIKISSNLVDVLFLLKNYNKAHKILNRNLEYFRQTEDIYGVIISLIKLGKLNYHLGFDNYSYSHKYLIDALDLINKLEIPNPIFIKEQLQWECFLYLGKLNLLWNNYIEAEDYLLKSLEAIRTFKIKESLNEANILKNLAKLYEIKGKYKTAIEYYNLSGEIYYKYGEDFEVAKLKKKIAQNYLGNIKNESDAINFYLEALEIFEDLNYVKESAEILHKLGDIYVNLGIIELALSNWTKAKKIYKDLLDEYNLNLVNEKIKSLIDSN